MTSPNVAAVDWIRSALREEKPGESEESIDAAAAVLHDSLSEYGVRVEALIVWIHRAGPDLDFGSWRALAIELAGLQSAYGASPEG